MYKFIAVTRIFKAFTLSEILITLGIIGLVAALTIPILMNNMQESQYKTAYKKAYSVLSQALLKARQEDNLIAFSGTNGGIGLEANFSVLKQYFVVTKECTAATLANCWNPNGEPYRSEAATVSFVDKSGMAWRIRHTDVDINVPTILVDINGNKQPNKYGQDRFPFYFSNSGSYDATSGAITGIPTKIIPNSDHNNNDYLMCPSYATHPCYYTTWLFGEN